MRGFSLAALGLAAIAAALASPASAAPKCRGQNATIVRGNGDDVVFGTPGHDVIVTRGGDDEIDGLGGKDRICAGGDSDTVEGGDKVDIIRGGSGGDVLSGGEDRDLLDGGNGPDHMEGDDPGLPIIADDLNGGDGDDDIFGEAETGTPSPGPFGVGDNISGGAGEDEMYGQESSDAVVDTQGQDFLSGGADNDVLRANDGHGGDVIDGGEGVFDTCDPDPGDTIDNCEQDDTPKAALPAAAKPECFGRTATIVKGDGDNTIVGTSGKDVIVAGGGDDEIEGGDGNDRICAGKGEDTADGEGDGDKVSGGKGDDTVSVFDGFGGELVDGDQGTDTCNFDPGDGFKSCEIVPCMRASVGAPRVCRSAGPAPPLRP